MSVETQLTGKIEPFDTFWEAPQNIEKGYSSFGKFYKRNYLRYLTKDKSASILAISCGPGYFLNLLKNEGYINTLGIDSDPVKVEFAKRRELNCETKHAFLFLETNKQPFDAIFVEQEINHLTKDEILSFLRLCRNNLNNNGALIVHSLNGANPITGSEALAQNFDHFNTFTEYSLKQVLSHSGFRDIRVFPLNLFVFYGNPLNYIGLFLNVFLNTLFRCGFIFYGKDNKIFSKKIAAVCRS